MKKHPQTIKDDPWRNYAVLAQKGDVAAYRILLNELLPYIKNVLVGQLANPEWAEEIAQEVLISVHKSLHTYQDDRAFKPWLRAIINFRKTDFLRKHYRRKGQNNVPLDVADYEPVDSNIRGSEGELKDIESALDDLPKKQRRIFQMVKIEGHTINDVAKTMGMSESAVKVSAHRAMKKLQDRLRTG